MNGDDGKGKPTNAKPDEAKDTSGAEAHQQQQQHAASGEGRQYGEGNYAATRQYNEGMKDHVENHDVEREARDAEPRTDAEEKEMEEAERIGRSRARDGHESPDAPEDEGHSREGGNPAENDS